MLAWRPADMWSGCRAGHAVVQSGLRSVSLSLDSCLLRHWFDMLCCYVYADILRVVMLTWPHGTLNRFARVSNKITWQKAQHLLVNL